MLAIVLVCTSLAQPKWISLDGGGCTYDGKALNYIGAQQFFYPGRLLSGVVQSEPTSYQFSPDPQDVLINCVNFKAALLMKTVIAFCFLSMLASLSGFILDLTVPKNRPCRLLQRNAIPSIVTVILSVVINLFCYWFTTEVERLQNQTKLPTSKVVVDFDISFYLITAAGGLSVFATAFNCLRRHPVYEESDQGESLLDDYDALDVLPPPVPESAITPNLPPPPAYTP